MIQMYAQGHIVAGILGTIATAGWTVQGLGLTFFYRQVRVTRRFSGVEFVLNNFSGLAASQC